MTDTQTKGPVALHLEEDDDSLTASVQRDNPDTSRTSPIHPPLATDMHEDSSIIDYNEIFQKKEHQSTRNLLKEMSRKRFSMREIEIEEKKQQLSYQEQLKQHYSTDYGGFKTPLIAFFYFFQFTTKQSKQIVDLFEGCDNKRNYEVELKEFGLRYCSNQKMMFFILFYFYNLVFQGQFIHPNDGKLVKEDGSREDAPNRNSFRRQQSRKMTSSTLKDDSGGEDIRSSLTQNNPYLPGDGLSTPYVNLLCFLTHFLSLKQNDYVIYFHWLLSYGNKTPLSKRDLTNVILILQKDQQVHRESVKTTASHVTSFLEPITRVIASLRPANAGQILSQYSFSSKKKTTSSQPSNSKGGTSRSVKVTNTYLNQVKDDNITSGLLRVIDTKMKGIISTSMVKLRRFLMQQTYSEKSFWSDIIRKMRGILYEQNTLNYYHSTVKQMHPEDVDLCYDFRIMKVRKTSERVLRRCVRYWQRYQQMMQLEAQSLSDLSGIDKSPSIYQRLCLPLFAKITAGGMTSAGSAKIHPEFHIENIRQLSILQGAEVSGSLIGGGGRTSRGKGRLSVNEAVKRLSVMLTRKNSKGGKYSQQDRDRQLQKISFKSLTARPVVPSNQELHQTTVKVKRKAFEAIDEVDRLLEEAKEPSRKTTATVSRKSVESKRGGEREEGSDDGYSDSNSESDRDSERDGHERHNDDDEGSEKRDGEQEEGEGKDDVAEEEGGKLIIAGPSEGDEMLADDIYHPDLAV